MNLNVRIKQQKTRLFLSICITLMFILISAPLIQVKAQEPDLVIYAYDSFVSEWGPAPFESTGNIRW